MGALLDSTFWNRFLLRFVFYWLVRRLSFRLRSWHVRIILLLHEDPWPLRGFKYFSTRHGNEDAHTISWGTVDNVRQAFALATTCHGGHRTSKAPMIALYGFGRLLGPCLLTSGRVLKSPGVEFWSISTYSLCELNQPFLFDPFCKTDCCAFWRRGLWLLRPPLASWVKASGGGHQWRLTQRPTGVRKPGSHRFPVLGQGQRLSEQWCVKNMKKCMGMGHVALPVLRRMLVACSHRRLDSEVVTWKWHHYGTHAWTMAWFMSAFALLQAQWKSKVRWNPAENMRSLRNSQQFQMLFRCSDCRCWGWLDILSKHQRMRKGKKMAKIHCRRKQRDVWLQYILCRFVVVWLESISTHLPCFGTQIRVRLWLFSCVVYEHSSFLVLPSHKRFATPFSWTLRQDPLFRVFA